jgi:hypothetical protein
MPQYDASISARAPEPTCTPLLNCELFHWAGSMAIWISTRLIRLKIPGKRSGMPAAARASAIKRQAVLRSPSPNRARAKKSFVITTSISGASVPVGTVSSKALAAS